MVGPGAEGFLDGFGLVGHGEQAEFHLRKLLAEANG